MLGRSDEAVAQGVPHHQGEREGVTSDQCAKPSVRQTYMYHFDVSWCFGTFSSRGGEPNFFHASCTQTARRYNAAYARRPPGTRGACNPRLKSQGLALYPRDAFHATNPSQDLQNKSVRSSAQTGTLLTPAQHTPAPTHHEQRGKIHKRERSKRVGCSSRIYAKDAAMIA